ncbi:MAG TPA: trypsin-like peptidase domain-containing protein [Acidimicrobiia bacterium]|nr:trypsin-like peptidase domain-containing protein [Acidimicrobiia bacterium]
MLGTDRPDEPEAVTADMPPVPMEPTISYEEPAWVAPPVVPPPTPQAPASKGPSRILAALLGGLLVAGGFGIGLLVDGDGAPVASGTEVTSTTAAGTTQILAEGDEPVAAVAAALLPSMVQIEAGFGLGSGFVYEDGHVLTAAHVVEGSNSVVVRFADGNQAQGTVLGTDTVHDVAVIEVDTNDTPVAPLALDEELVVGQLAVALGSPWGLEQTVTSGVVSAVDRPVANINSVQVLIQTDASINPGNSGGALADRQGRVIGVNIEIFTQTGTNSGVGFAVPIAVAHDIAQQIVAGTPIETAYLGVTGEDATGAQAGALITEIVAAGPAAGSGLEVGDLVTAVDALGVRSMTDLAGRIRSYSPNDSVVLDVIRNGESITLTVTLGVRPADG